MRCLLLPGVVQYATSKTRRGNLESQLLLLLFSVVGIYGMEPMYQEELDTNPIVQEHWGQRRDYQNDTEQIWLAWTIAGLYQPPPLWTFGGDWSASIIKNMAVENA